MLTRSFDPHVKKSLVVLALDEMALFGYLIFLMFL